MARACCLSGIDPNDVPLLGAALKSAGEQGLAILTNLGVAELRKLTPDVLIADVDRLEVDQFELLRQIRFVLPDCVMAVYTAVVDLSWARACHLAGATCVLSKESSESQLASGLRHAIRSGCFTDPRFAA